MSITNVNECECGEHKYYACIGVNTEDNERKCDNEVDRFDTTNRRSSTAANSVNQHINQIFFLNCIYESPTNKLIKPYVIHMQTQEQ